MSETRIVGMPDVSFEPDPGTRKVKIEIPIENSTLRSDIEEFNTAANDPRDESATVIVDRGPVKVAASNETSAKTRLVGFPSFSAQAESPAATAAMNTGDMIQEPVVAWLVAVTGPMKGQFFSLKVGQNTIGRDPQANRVCISGDPGISRNGHLIIIYDPRRVCFVVRPGSEGAGITDLNNELLTSPMPLEHGDFLRLTDDTTLRFIPFCDTAFHW